MNPRTMRRAFRAAVDSIPRLAALPWREIAAETLTPRLVTEPIAPPTYPETKKWSHDGLPPGATIRVPRGARVSRRLLNGLPVLTSVNWHGIRKVNADDNVVNFCDWILSPSNKPIETAFAVGNAT